MQIGQFLVACIIDSRFGLQAPASLYGLEGSGLRESASFVDASTLLANHRTHSMRRQTHGWAGSHINEVEVCGVWGGVEVKRQQIDEGSGW